MDAIHTYTRALWPALNQALGASPVVVVTGARHIGKSTLVRALSGRSHVNLEDPETLARVQKGNDWLNEIPGALTLEEIQRAPQILRAVKRRCDRDKANGKLLVTASADVSTLKPIAQALGKKVAWLTLWPLTRREQRGLGTTGAWREIFNNPHEQWLELLANRGIEDDWRIICRRGGFPVPAIELRGDQQRMQWLDGHVRDYLENELGHVASVSSVPDFKRLMRAAAAHLGEVVNQAELAREVGLSPATVHRHLNVLETSYQFIRLPAFDSPAGKRMVKGPKLYAGDVGLGLRLAGRAKPRGVHLENLILCDLLAWREAMQPHPEIRFWRTTTGREVDFVVAWKDRLLPVHVRATERPSVDHTTSLKLFREEHPEQTMPGLLLHCGDSTTWITEGILAAPWWRVL